ncbi:MAG: LysR family transcriptional regulator [Rhodospirillales bacterium]|nr:LysR family transcriptional regulator [Rhodospirillales bacterium]
MDLLYTRALSHFVAAYDSRNLRAAAEVALVAQPAISKSILKLEAHIGIPLFDRTTTGVKPTEFAHILRRHAQNIMNESRFVDTEIAAITGGSGGLLRVGVGPAWSLGIFLRLLSRFQARFPNIDLTVETDVTDHLLPLLKEGDLDLWLGSLHDVEETAEVSVWPVGWSDMKVFVAGDHPLAGRAEIAPADLCGYSWACFKNDQRGLERLSRYFEDRSLPKPRYALRLSSIVTMLSAAASSDLLVFAADSLGDEAKTRGLTPLPLTEPIWGFETGMAFRHSTAELSTIRFIKSALTEDLVHSG